MNRQSLRSRMDELLSGRECDKAQQLLVENMDIAKTDRDLLRVYYMLPICTAEKENGQRILFSKVTSVEELVERERKLKFYLRRIAFDLLEDEEEFYRYCNQNQVSLPELFIVTYCNAVHREKVQEFIQRKMREGKLAV